MSDFHRREQFRTVHAAGSPKLRRVILQQSLASGGTATARWTKFDVAEETWIDTGRTMTVREILGVSSPISAGTVCIAARFPGAGWCIINTGC